MSGLLTNRAISKTNEECSNLVDNDCVTLKILQFSISAPK